MRTAKSHSDKAKARIYIYQNRAKDKSTKITVCALKHTNASLLTAAPLCPTIHGTRYLWGSPRPKLSDYKTTARNA